MQFPAEFDDLVDSKALRDRNRPAPKTDLRSRKERLAWYPLLISRSAAARAIRLLDQHLDQYLRPVRSRIPASSISSMRWNYSEKLPKTLANRSVILNDARSKASRAAARIGLLAMVGSDSLLRFAEYVAGYKLDPERGCQVICYQPGDYVGPHNDHHPEEPHLRSGYVDLHITLSTGSVAHQLLVYENRGFLTQVLNVGIRSGVAVSHLPFWHFTTPLVPKTGKDRYARRWVIMVSFTIDQSRRRSA